MNENNQKHMKRFLGFINDKDERELQIIYSKIVSVFFISFYLTILFAFISICFDAYFKQISLGSILLMVLGFVETLTVMISLRKEDVRDELVTSQHEYRQLLKKIRFQCFISGIFIVFTYLIFSIVFNLCITKQLQIEGYTLFSSFIAGFVFSFLSYFVAKSKIKIED
ncbi:hypothetical protein [Staphylococcus sp. Marseille-Q5304]|uniref:hypothetical protein n=1 Tax=Staphylococcus sp. Marseille-Q5304 TaxID=2942200 RepID=UPI002073740C|nr:hypothetical protein [Staphylococcus sp. Marseille-Q5304]